MSSLRFFFVQKVKATLEVVRHAVTAEEAALGLPLPRTPTNESICNLRDTLVSLEENLSNEDLPKEVIEAIGVALKGGSATFEVVDESVVDEISVFNSWRERLNRFFHELQEKGWIVDGGSGLSLEYSSVVCQSGPFPAEDILKMREIDPTLRSAAITVNIKAYLPLENARSSTPRPP